MEIVLAAVVITAVAGVVYYFAFRDKNDSTGSGSGGRSDPRNDTRLK